MKKRFLAVVLSLCLMIGLFPAAALADGDTKWTNVVTAQPAGYAEAGDGNVTISSAEGLAWLAKQVNEENRSFSGKTITLTDKIDLSAHEWVPIGTQARPFSGTFDGVGHMISGMDVVVSTDSPVAGLFGIVSECTIKDTTLVGARITGVVVGPEEPNDNDWETANDYLDTMIGGIAAANKKASSAPNTVTIQGCDVEDLTVNLITNDGVDVSIGGILGKTDDFRFSKATIIGCNADIAVTYQSNTDDNRTYIGGAIGELCSPKQTNVLENGNFSLSVTVPQNAAELVEFRYSIGGAIGYMGTFSNSLVDPIVQLRDISCHSTLDFSGTNGILPNSISFFEADFSAGGMIGRGSDFHMERCFAMIDLSGPENEEPTDFGNLVGFTQNTDTITCDKVYTYAIRYQGVNTYYENEECASNINWSIAENIKDLYYIERQTLTVNQAGAPFLYQTFSDEYSTTEDLNDTVTYTDGKEDDITVSHTEEGTQVTVDKATDACFVHGELTPDEGFTVAFTLPVIVEDVTSQTYAITTEVSDLTNPGGYTGCNVTTEPAEKAKAGDQVTITVKPVPPGTKLVDSVKVTTADDTKVSVTKISSGVTGEQTYTFIMPAADVTVTGVFRAVSTEFTLSPNPVVFEVYEGYTAEDVEPQTVTITNTGDKDATFTGIYKIPAKDANDRYVISPTGEGWGGTDGREITIAPGKTATLTIRPKERLTSADNPNSSSLYFSSREGMRVQLKLECTVKQVPVYVLTATPATLSFGQLYEGYTAPSGQTVTLTNTGSQDLTVTLPTSEHFTITPDSSWNNGTATLAPNGTVTVTVTPKQGLAAGNYQDALLFATDQPSVSAQVDASVQVNPSGTYTITATAGPYGTISPSGAVVVPTGSDQSFTITPDIGCYIRDVQVNGVSVGAVTSYTFSEVRKHHSIRVFFAQDSSGGTDPNPGPAPNPDTPNDYTVYYHSNFGSDKTFYQSGSDYRMTVRDYGDMSRLPHREGYVFAGWNTKADGSGEDYEPGSTFRVSGSSSHLYAQWMKDGFTPADTGVSHWLNTKDHVAYLSGYGTGLFGPDNRMTRAQAAQMFYNLLLDRNVSATSSFKDVPADAWCYDAVSALSSMGIIQGYQDGTFRPNQPITRAQFAAIVTRFAGAGVSEAQTYTDVPADYWAYDAIFAASGWGWITGYDDGTFHPDATVTRAQVAVIVNRMLGRSADEQFIDRSSSELISFSDLTVDHWAYYAVTEAANSHMYTKDGNAEVWTGIA